MYTGIMDRECWVVLLRGINVGGRNRLRMADLRSWLEAGGFRGARTYIQSGNILIRAPVGQDAAAIERAIHDLIGRNAGLDVPVFALRGAELVAAVQDAPAGFEDDPDAWRRDVLFLRPPLTSDAVLAQVPLREGVDRAWAGAGVVYFARLDARAGSSYLSKLTALAIYQQMTVRNWRTSCTLAGMVADACA